MAPTRKSVGKTVVERIEVMFCEANSGDFAETG